jgi:chromate transporter
MSTGRPSLLEIFFAALRLGCTSFGGPVAHLGYFHREYVERRRWLDEQQYAGLVALCQFLPGPASSQVGFGVGYSLRGWSGGVLAWIGFTGPSTILMIGFAYGVASLGQVGEAGWLQGLKIAAVAVVAQAVIVMWRNLCPDWPRSSLAAGAAGLLLLFPTAWSQVAVILLGGMLGWLWLNPKAQTYPDNETVVPRQNGLPWLVAFFVPLVVLPVLTHFFPFALLQIAEKFYRVGALVFGGGHAVLPLMEREVVPPGWLTHEQFLAGYGAAQAVPGPLFTFAAYLGTMMRVGPGGWLGGVWALLCVFTPAVVLVAGVLPYWQRLRSTPRAGAALRGANAAVVGALLAALIDPVALTGLPDWQHATVALAAFGVLLLTKVPAWAVVAGCALLSQILF